MAKDASEGEGGGGLAVVVTADREIPELLFAPWEDRYCGGCRLAVRCRAAGQAGAGCADHEPPDDFVNGAPPSRTSGDGASADELVRFVAAAQAAQAAVDELVTVGEAVDELEAQHRAALVAIARDTARLWRGLSYTEAIDVATLARRRLQLVRPQRERRAVERLTRADVDRLLGHAYRVRGDRGLMLQTLLLTGARVSELVALEIRDVDVAARTVRIRRGKGGKARTVPILERLAVNLAIHVANRRTAEPLFRARGRVPRALSKRRVQQLLAELAAGAAIRQRVYPHLLRHTIAQHLLEGGMPLEQVGRFLGHAHVTTTQIYAEPSQAMVAESYRRALAESD